MLFRSDIVTVAPAVLTLPKLVLQVAVPVVTRVRSPMSPFVSVVEAAPEKVSTMVDVELLFTMLEDGAPNATVGLVLFTVTEEDAPEIRFVSPALLASVLALSLMATVPSPVQFDSVTVAPAVLTLLKVVLQVAVPVVTSVRSPVSPFVSVVEVAPEKVSAIVDVVPLCTKLVDGAPNATVGLVLFTVTVVLAELCALVVPPGAVRTPALSLTATVPFPVQLDSVSVAPAVDTPLNEVLQFAVPVFTKVTWPVSPLKKIGRAHV